MIFAGQVSISVSIILRAIMSLKDSRMSLKDSRNFTYRKF